MRRAFLIPLLAVSALASPAAAANWDASFAKALPEETLAKAAVDAYPDVDRARAELTIAKARSRELDAGPYEVTVNANTADNYPSFTWDVSRTVRLPGKARLDRQSGRLGVQAAEDLVDDARHQTGLMLSDAWYAWVQAEAALTLDREIEASAKTEVDAVRKRIEVKDASQLDLEQAEAALATAAAHRALSEGQSQTAKLALIRSFPNLPAPVRSPDLPEPPILEHPAAEWSDITVKSSHEIAIADFQARQAETEAKRVRLDRTPDPTVGLRAIPDPRPGGRYAVKGVGVYVSVPFGGSRRAALGDSAAGKAQVAEINLIKVRREVAALGERNALTSQATRNAWISAQAAVEAGRTAADRTQRGYALGELDLTQVLQAQRQLNELRRAEVTARVDAWRAVTHLRLDAHDLWHDAD
ncbi:MAG: TolC family protein [Caulobacteraceae bacterium]